MRRNLKIVDISALQRLARSTAHCNQLQQSACDLAVRRFLQRRRAAMRD
jgi:hypothetical protein